MVGDKPSTTPESKLPKNLCTRRGGGTGGRREGGGAMGGNHQPQQKAKHHKTSILDSGGVGVGGQNHQPHQKAKYPKTGVGGDDRKLAKYQTRSVLGMCVCVWVGGGRGQL